MNQNATENVKAPRVAEKQIRVLCVDDNEMLADSVERRLEFEPRFEWAGWIAGECDIGKRVTESNPDIILVDVDMPGIDAFDTVRSLSASHPSVRCVIFSGHLRQELIDQAVEAGAWGYISKVAGIDEVLNAMERVAKGEFVLSEDALAEQQRM